MTQCSLASNTRLVVVVHIYKGRHHGVICIIPNKQCHSDYHQYHSVSNPSLHTSSAQRNS